MSVDAASDGGDAPSALPDEAERARRLEAVTPMVRAMCASRLRRSDSDDAAQAVLEQVWRAQHQQAFADEESVRRYAATVARVMPASADRRSVRAAPIGSVAEALWVDEASGPAERFDRTEAMAEAAEKVAALLERLTPREREIIRETHLGERSTADAARELGLTPSGVRSAQTRAMARMRESMDVESSNPLASGVPERERRRSNDQQQDRGYPQGPRSAPVIEAADRFVSEQGRPPSRSELVRLTGTSNGTAQRVIRALRDERAALRGEEFGGSTRSVDLAVELPDRRPDTGADGLSLGSGAETARPERADLSSANEYTVDEHEAGQQLELIPAVERDGEVRERVRPAERDVRSQSDLALRGARAAVARAQSRAAQTRLAGETDRDGGTACLQPVLWDADGVSARAEGGSGSVRDHDEPSDAAGP